MGSEQRLIQMPSQKRELESYDWGKISPANKVRIKQGVKLLETRDADELNEIERVGEYYFDRWSESRGVFMLTRRERRTA